MPKIKNKFIIFVIFIIIGILAFGVFMKYYNNKVDRNSYVVLLNGQARLNDEKLLLNIRELLSVGDTVRTIGESSLVVLEWGDGSLTRLGGNSKVEVKEMDISDNLSNINIGFELFSGKSWSNVVSFLGEGSYFKEYFRDSEAAARGTIFNVDLTNNYLYVLDHEVTLNTNLSTGSGKTIVIDEKKPLEISSFNFISLENFLKSFKDKDWEKLNQAFDLKLFNGLKEQIHKDLDDLLKFKDLDLEEVLTDKVNKSEMYNKLLSDYQKLNFVKSTDGELFTTKLQLKEALLKVVDDENKQSLVDSTLFDFKDIVDSKDYKQLDTILPILVKNKDYLGKIDFKDYFNNGIIPEEIKNKITDYFGNLKNFFGEKYNEVKEIDIIEEVKNVNDKAKDIIQDGLDDLFIK